MTGDHDGVVGKGDMEGGGRRSFIMVGGMDGKEVAGGAGVKDCGGNSVGGWGGT